MFYFFSCMIIFLVLVFSISYFKTFYSPAAINALAWLLILSLHALAPHGLYPLSELVILIVVGSVLCFFVGALVATQFFSPSRQVAVINAGDSLSCFYNWYFFIALVGAPFVFNKAVELAAHATTPSFMINLRMALTNEEYGGGYGGLAYLTIIAFSGFFLMTAASRKRIFSFQYALYFCLCVYYAVMATGRTFLFLLIIPVSFIFLYSGGRKSSYLLIVGAPVAMLLSFVVIGAVLGKLGGGVDEGVTTFWVYLLGGITAFDAVLMEGVGGGYGENTLRTFFSILNNIGFDVDVVSLVKEYSYVPLPTNVYTVFYPYFLDFGLFFALLVQFFLGIGHHVLYSRAIAGDVRFILLSSLSMYPLIMQCFQDQYFSLLTTWVVFFLLLLVPFTKVKARICNG